MSPEDIARRRDGKRFNERMKLVAAFANNSGIAILVGAFALPYLNTGFQSERGFGLWILTPFVLHKSR